MPEESTVNNSSQVEAPVPAPPANGAKIAQSGAQVETGKSVPDDFFVAEEYGESFSALKNAMSQGHDLRKKRKALEEYNKTLSTLKAAHADRVNIAQNYDAVVAEQRGIVSECESAISGLEDRQGHIDAQISQANAEMARLKRAQAEALKPLEDELSRCEAQYASAKDELKQVRAQRNSLGLFEDGQGGPAGEVEAHDDIVSRVENKLESAKSARKVAQKACDDQVKADKAAQRQITDSVKKLNSEKGKLSKEIESRQKELSAAQQRIAFCEHVVEHPDETESMLARIEENERTAANMAEQIEELASVHSERTEAASKARTVVIVGIIAVVVIVALFIFLSFR